MNRQIIGVVIYRALKIRKNLLQCNKYCVITIPIYPVPKYLYPGLNFIQVGAKKQYIYRYCFLKTFSILSRLNVTYYKFRHIIMSVCQ